MTSTRDNVRGDLADALEGPDIRLARDGPILAYASVAPNLLAEQMSKINHTPRSSARPEGAALPSILVVDDDDDIREALGELLREAYRVTFARDGAEAMDALRLQTFDLSILDLDLPVLDGFQLVQAIHGAGQAPRAAVMLLSAHASPKLKVRALALGAVDYMTKPFDADELMARVARILASVVREAGLRADAMTDSLTGLANGRSFLQSLDREVARSRRHHLPLSLLAVDLDHLKLINDAHGHDAGNDALRLAANVLAGAVRTFEVVARQGGDEFAVILPNTAASAARALAERLCGELHALVVHGERLSASIGVASGIDGSLDAAALVKASDEALYHAKRAGRGRVEVAVQYRLAAGTSKER
ncbi:MAG: response regulator receiver modulated diguanylate cyclase [Myxococcales bacterium]|nr:response regulator receiver modulated diguanylate cyclase [Myxococcales bacterium]